MDSSGGWRAWLLVTMLLGAGCATGQAREDAGEGSHASGAGGGSDNQATLPEGCERPRRATLVEFTAYAGELCPRESGEPIALRSEDAFAARVACMEGGGSRPSGIDWSRHQLFVFENWWQGSPGRVVSAHASGGKTELLFFDPPYCGGAAPPEGQQRLALLLPKGEGALPTLRYCDAQPCAWARDSMAPPP